MTHEPHPNDSKPAMENKSTPTLIGYPKSEQGVTVIGSWQQRDMSHYRRRLPSEKPPLQTETIIFKVDSLGLRMGYFDKFDGDTEAWCSGEDGYSDAEIEFWSYCYIPLAEEKGGK